MKENQSIPITSEEERGAKKLARKNLYISKPFKNLNHDMKDTNLTQNNTY